MEANLTAVARHKLGLSSEINTSAENENVKLPIDQHKQTYSRYQSCIRLHALLPTLDIKST
jgi:hypothetical protein